MTAGMDDAVLIVMSGKVNGFSVMAVPFMLVTCNWGTGALGRIALMGVEVMADLPPIVALPVTLHASRRIAPAFTKG